MSPENRERVLCFAQKGVILDSTGTKILVSRYLDSKYLPGKLNGRDCLPGGKLEFGQEPDESFIEEVFQETGVTITPLLPFHTWTWTYEKGETDQQIVAVARFGLHKEGEIQAPTREKETTLDTARWVPLSELDISSFVEDEQPVLRAFLEYQRKNPFE